MDRHRTRRAAVLACALAALALAAAPARAEPTAADLETARALFKEGKELRTQGHLEEALEKLRAAHTLGQTPITGLELARTYVMLKKLVEARDVALSIARIPVASDETDRSAEARKDAAALAEDLRGRIPSIVIRVARAPNARGAAVVEVDGERVPDAALAEPRRVDPGPHSVTATLGATVARATITVAEKESLVVVLDLSSATPEPPAPLAPTPRTPAAAPDGFFFGAEFVVAPHLYFTATEDAPAYKTVVEVMAGAAIEAGAALTPDFEIMGRGFAALGDRGKPSYAIAAGPAFSYRVAPRVWLGGGVLAGRADTKFDSLPYSTDWVLALQGEASYAVLDTPHGQWLVSVMPGFYFANVRSDNEDLFVNVGFGFRSY